MKDESVRQLFTRWESLLRNKAEQYEHTARKEGKPVTSPDIDDICNEMDVFVVGFLAAGEGDKE